MDTLILRHLPGTSPPRFEFSGQDQRSSDPVSIPSPYGFPVEDCPDSDLMQEMRWYLEEFLEYPFSPNAERSQHILNALTSWGTQALAGISSSGESGRAFMEKVRQGWNNFLLTIESDDPQILQWPWEALAESQNTWLGVVCRIARRLSRVPEPIPIPEDLPRDRINILLVTARPYESDIGFRSIARSLVELMEKNEIPAHISVLRPPTFEHLRRHLKERRHFYHLIHFDVHGGYGKAIPREDDTRLVWVPEGALIFEDNKGKPDCVTAEDLGRLMVEYEIPAVVLNACSSAMIAPQARDPFASVASTMLKAGVRGVVVMAYSLYVSGARVFLPVFYRNLFQSGDLSLATLAGRREMFSRMKRVCACGRYELRDFIVPAIYCQEPFALSFHSQGEFRALEKTDLPQAAKDEANPYGFVGRDHELFKIERAMRTETPAILIQGIGGVGKTTLARGFLKWLNDTQGLDGCLWLSFTDIRSAEYMIDCIGAALFGHTLPQFYIDYKIEALVKALRSMHLVMVWDNFEAAVGIPGTNIKPNLPEEERDILLSLLKKIRGGRTKVIITSRNKEEWLAAEHVEISLSGLVSEERWEYGETILDRLKLPQDREDQDMVELMNFLDGHPLAMRAVLPRLEIMSARKLIDSLQSSVVAIDTEDLGPEYESLYAAMRLIEEHLPGELQPLLVPLSLHENYVDTNFLDNMASLAGEKWPRRTITSLFRFLAAAGLLSNVTGGVYELHPVLTGYLRSSLLKRVSRKVHDNWSHAFVEVMRKFADTLIPHPLQKQRFGFLCHGANFRFAVDEAERLGMNSHRATLLQALAVYALNTRNFSEARELSLRLADMGGMTGDKKVEALAYHNLGMSAQGLRDFSGAQKWYEKSLEVLEKPEEEPNAANTYFQLGLIAEERKDFQSARNWLVLALQVYERFIEHYKVKESIGNTYQRLGEVAQKGKDFDQAGKWHIKALEIRNSSGDQQGAAGSLQALGIIAGERKDYAEAQKCFHEALAILEELGDEEGLARTYHELGKTTQKQGDFAEAQKWYYNSLEINEKLGNVPAAALSYEQMGILAQEQSDFETAQKWHRKCLDISLKHDIRQYEGSSYLQLGKIEQDLGNYRAAQKWYSKALHIFENYDFPHEAANTYHQMGILAQERKDYSAAEEWHHKALKTRESLSDDYGIAMSYAQLGIIAGRKKDFTEGSRLFIKCIKAFSRSSDSEGMKKGATNFVINYLNSPPELQPELKKIWEEAGLGPFKEVEDAVDEE